VHAPASLLEIVWYIIWGACLYILCFQDRQAEICTIIFWKPWIRFCKKVAISWPDWLCTSKRRAHPGIPEGCSHLELDSSYSLDFNKLNTLSWKVGFISSATRNFSPYLRPNHVI